MKLNNVDLNKVAVFCQIIDSGNYREAAEALNVTPSALSQTVSNLEHSLGVQLFRRNGRKLQPTSGALKLHKEFRHYHTGLLRAVGNLAERQNQVEGLVRVGAYLEFAKTRLAPPLREFLQRHKEAQVKFVFDTPTRLHRLLEAGQIDLCFSIYPSKETRSIVSEPIYREELVLISPRKTFTSAAPTFDEILAQPVVEYYQNHQPLQRWLKLHFPRRHAKQLDVRTYAATAEMVLALVREGLGIAVVPRYLLTKADLENLDVIRPTERRFLDHIWILHQQSMAGPASRALNALVREHFA